MSELDEWVKELIAENPELSPDGTERLKLTMALYDGEDKLYTSKEIEDELREKPRPEGFKTGIENLDDLTGGFRMKQVITMFAHTKHGKTEVGTWLMSRFPELNPVLIPLEQDAEEIISQRMEKGYQIPHFVAPKYHDTFVSPEWIEHRVIEGIAKYDSRMVVIDHLGYIDNNGKDGAYKRENLAYRLGQVMKEVKGIAKKWDVIIILLAHISEGDEGQPPQLKDIGNSSDIKKESDTVIAIWRKNSLKNKIRVYDPDNKTMLSVLANRRFGKNGNVGLLFSTETGTYREDNSWVESMEDMARTAVEADELFVS